MKHIKEYETFLTEGILKSDVQDVLNDAGKWLMSKDRKSLSSDIHSKFWELADKEYSKKNLQELISFIEAHADFDYLRKHGIPEDGIKHIAKRALKN